MSIECNLWPLKLRVKFQLKFVLPLNCILFIWQRSHDSVVTLKSSSLHILQCGYVKQKNIFLISRITKIVSNAYTMQFHSRKLQAIQHVNVTWMNSKYIVILLILQFAKLCSIKNIKFLFLYDASKNAIKYIVDNSM